MFVCIDNSRKIMMQQCEKFEVIFIDNWEGKFKILLESLKF